MLQPRRSTPTFVSDFLHSQREAPFSYQPVGATRADPPSAPLGYLLDHRQIQLGTGAKTFAAAQQAVRAWKMFSLPWVELVSPAAPIEPGTLVAVVARTAGLWVLGACRIVYVIDEPRRFGFAYGTLGQHMERRRAVPGGMARG